MIAIICLDYVNFPIQLGITFISVLLAEFTGGPNGILAVQMILTLFGGTAWWYFLGTLIVRGKRRLFKKSVTPIANN